MEHNSQASADGQRNNYERLPTSFGPSTCLSLSYMGMSRLKSGRGIEACVWFRVVWSVNDRMLFREFYWRSSKKSSSKSTHTHAPANMTLSQATGSDSL